MTAPMWMPDCPTEETLAAFIDNKLDAATRRKVTEHLADCAECRELVLMASEYEAENEPVPVPRPVFRFPSWIAASAGLAATAGLAFFVGWPMLFGPDFSDVLETSQKMEKVHFKARLAGGFAHIKYESPKRGGNADQNNQTESEPGVIDMANIAANDARFGDPHVRGVAMLLGTNDPEDTDEAIRLLKEAYQKASPGDERDTIALNLTAALLARDRWGSTDQRKRDQLALDLSTDVWSRKHTPEAAWNRALALEVLERQADAIKAWDDYLKVDSTSDWAKEAQENRSDLVDLLSLKR